MVPHALAVIHGFDKYLDRQKSAGKDGGAHGLCRRPDDLAQHIYAPQPSLPPDYVCRYKSVVHELIPRIAEEDLMQAALLANEEVSRALNDYEDLMRAASAAAGGPLGARSSTGGAAPATAAAAAGSGLRAGSSSGGAGGSNAGGGLSIVWVIVARCCRTGGRVAFTLHQLPGGGVCAAGWTACANKRMASFVGVLAAVGSSCQRAYHDLTSPSNSQVCSAVLSRPLHFG